jgi:hypothetical protein
MRRAALVPVCVCASRSEKTLSHPDPAAWGHVVTVETTGVIFIKRTAALVQVCGCARRTITFGRLNADSRCGYWILPEHRRALKAHVFSSRRICGNFADRCARCAILSSLG